MNKVEGKLVANGAKIGIVAARFNEFIVSKLVSGAEDALLRHDVNADDITVAWVPGAFEIPVIAKKMAASGKYDAVICLGAVIRGATSHYDYVCNEVSKGVASVSLETGVPVMFGASLLKIAKYAAVGMAMTGTEWVVLIVGCLVAFFVSVFVIKFLMGYIKKHDFKVFGVYRIILGIAVIALSFVLF